MPPGALASIRIATAGTAASVATSARVARERVRAPGGRWAVRKPTASPAIVSDASISNSNPPNACPESIRTARSVPSTDRPPCANAHATTGTETTRTPPSIASARSRNGTSASQIASAIPAASSEPRE